MSSMQRKVWLRVLGASAMALSAALAARFFWSESDSGRKPPERAQAQLVQLTRALREDLTLSARHAGELDTDAAEIAAQTAGLLQSVHVRIGDAVDAGDPLADVDPSEFSRQLLQARAQVRARGAASARVKAELGAASGELARTEPLLSEQLVSAQELDVLKARVLGLEAEAVTARAQREEAQATVALLQDKLRRSKLVAPFAGAVAERYLDPGATVQPGTPVLRIVKTGPLRVHFRVPERELSQVAVGMPLWVKTQATGEERFSGKVSRLSAAVARSDRSLAVEGQLDQAEQRLKPGMYAQVELDYGTLENVISVPISCLVEQVGTDGEPQPGVYRVQDQLAHFARVEVLGRAGGKAAIAGVPEGSAIVSAGQEGLRDGAKVQTREGD